jgi:hypothetical protein
MVYVPATYDLRLPPDIKNKHDLQVVDIGHIQNTTEKYLDDIDKVDIENKYQEVVLENDRYDFREDERSPDIEDKLLSSYKKPINIRSLDTKTLNDLKDIVNQLNRLYYCIQSMRYTLGIVHNKYICMMDGKTKSVTCFESKTLQNEDRRKLFIVMDLELLYEKLDIIQLDIPQIKDGIFRILEKNQVTHSNSLAYIIRKTKNLSEHYKFINQRKETVAKYLVLYKKLLIVLCKSEEDIYNKIKRLDNKLKSQSSLHGADSDISHSHEKKQFSEKLGRLQTLKNEIMNKIIELSTNNENINLMVDKILFNNIVMLDSVHKNVRVLSKLYE